MKYITLPEAEWAISLLPKILHTPEPIGPIDQDAKEKLEAAITQPFVRFAGHYHYRFLYQRAALMFYLLIKDHAMENGNKRSAVIITMYFLFKNGKTFDLSPDTLYDLACDIADAKPENLNSDDAVQALARTFKDHIVRI